MRKSLAILALGWFVNNCAGQTPDPCNLLGLDSTFTRTADSLNFIALRNVDLHGSDELFYFYESYISQYNITATFFDKRNFNESRVIYFAYIVDKGPVDSILNGTLRYVIRGFLTDAVTSWSFTNGKLTSMAETLTKARNEYLFIYLNCCEAPIIIETTSYRHNWKWNHSMKYYIFTSSGYKTVLDRLFVDYLHTLLERR